MCWISNKLPIERTAPRNIPIYKVLRLSSNAVLLSPWYALKYEPNKKVTSFLAKPKGLEPIPNCCGINTGLHSLQKTKLRRQGEYIGILRRDTFGRNIFEGRYSFYNSALLLYEGYIPQGSKYYLNEYGEYVSDSLIITKPANFKTIKKYSFHL